MRTGCDRRGESSCRPAALHRLIVAGADLPPSGFSRRVALDDVFRVRANLGLPALSPLRQQRAPGAGDERRLVAFDLPGESRDLLPVPSLHRFVDPAPGAFRKIPSISAPGTPGSHPSGLSVIAAFAVPAPMKPPANAIRRQKTIRREISDFLLRVKSSPGRPPDAGWPRRGFPRPSPRRRSG